MRYYVKVHNLVFLREVTYTFMSLFGNMCNFLYSLCLRKEMACSGGGMGRRDLQSVARQKVFNFYTVFSDNLLYLQA